MKSQKLLSYTIRAITDYDMISPGDKIAIGILRVTWSQLHGLQNSYRRDRFRLQEGT